MPKPLFSRLRLIAATLITCSGAAHIASLWFRELNGIAVISALIGAVYLIIGIGLYGRSRFTLFVAMVIPLAHAGLVELHTATSCLHPAQLAGMAADVTVALFSTAVLWHVRHEPSV
jgi:hypothetical protein